MSRYEGRGPVMVAAAVVTVMAGPLAAPAAATATAATAATAGTADSGTFARVDRAVADVAAASGYPGVEVAITRHGRVVHAAGHGRDPRDRAVSASTPMPVGSVSKSFTALAVMQLVDAGRVGLDRPVRAYLPGFRVADPRGSRITVRDLLDHTSGITDRTLHEKRLPQPASLRDAVVRARQARLAAAPGQAFAYTNTNYHLAGRLVEVVSGEPFGAYLRRHVFDPIGMRSTRSVDVAPRDVPPTVSEGHVYAYGASVAVPEPHRLVAGSDGVISTARDMARWLTVQQGGGRTPTGRRIVSAEAIRTMHRPSGPHSGGFGLGWYPVDGGGVGGVGHDGEWFTYTAGQRLLRNGYGIAVLTSSGISLGNEGVGQLEDAVTAALAGHRVAKPFPQRLAIDLVLAGLTLLGLAAGVRGLVRARAWAYRLRTRPPWRLGLRLLPYLVPGAVLVTSPDLIGAVAGGRDISLGYLVYYSPALVTLLTVTTVLGLGTVARRVVVSVRLRRRRDAAPAGAAGTSATTRAARSRG